MFTDNSVTMNSPKSVPTDGDDETKVKFSSLMVDEILTYVFEVCTLTVVSCGSISSLINTSPTVVQNILLKLHMGSYL